MQERLNVELELRITTPEGKEWATTLQRYVDMPYEAMLDIEDAMLRAGLDLNQTARKQVAEFIEKKRQGLL